jgi:hypothetical protein
MARSRPARYSRICLADSRRGALGVHSTTMLLTVLDTFVCRRETGGPRLLLLQRTCSGYMQKEIQRLSDRKVPRLPGSIRL